MKDIKTYVSINEKSLTDIENDAKKFIGKNKNKLKFKTDMGSFYVQNIVISNRGAMNDNEPMSVAKSLVKNYPNAKLWVYDCGKEKVKPINDLSEYNIGGPHSLDLSGLAEFYKKHMGEITIFIQN